MEFEEVLANVWKLCDSFTNDAKRSVSFLVNKYKCEVTAVVTGKGMRKFVFDRVSDGMWTMRSLKEFMEG